MERHTIREWKSLKRFTADEIAKKCGVSRVSVMNWMKDGGSIKMSHAIKLAEAFDCKLDDIIFLP